MKAKIDEILKLMEYSYNMGKNMDKIKREFEAYGYEVKNHFEATHPEFNPEYPPEGTTLNPTNEFLELHACIAPLKDLGFEWIDKWARQFQTQEWSKESASNWKILGECLDRLNEYFYGR